MVWTRPVTIACLSAPIVTTTMFAIPTESVLALIETSRLKESSLPLRSNFLEFLCPSNESKIVIVPRHRCARAVTQRLCQSPCGGFRLPRKRQHNGFAVEHLAICGRHSNGSVQVALGI